METEELLEQIRQDVMEVREKGQLVVDAAELDSYLIELKETAARTREERQRAHQSQLEHFKATHESNLAQYSAENQHLLEMGRSVVILGQGALKSAMLVSGAAAAALLGFLSNAWTKDVPQSLRIALPESLLLFVFGVLAAAVASGFAYLSQEAFASRQQRLGYAARGIVIALTMASYILFGLGAWRAYVAFIKAA